MAASFNCDFQAIFSAHKPSTSLRFDLLRTSLPISVKPFFRELSGIFRRINVPEIVKGNSIRIIDAVVDLIFGFVDQPLLPSQRNFAPVEELGQAVQVSGIEGRVPDDFPQGVYIRNGPNPLFGGLKSAVSMFGRSSHIWVEGEGMLHASYFKKDSDGKWAVVYNNRHVETETLYLEKQRNRPSFLPAIEGDSLAVLSAYLLNLLRFGKVNKELSNTNVFEHSGKFYAVAENHLPQEIDIFTLESLGQWDVNGAWNRPFISHPKKSPGASELVTLGVDAKKPFIELGVISADGKKLVHKVDLEFKRASICHDIGVTQRYNVILDFPLTIDINRLVKGGPLVKYNKEDYARIGIMPRFGKADSIKWFYVEPSMVFHILNCFEDGEEVILRACRALQSILPGPDLGKNKFEWFSRGFKTKKQVAESGEGSPKDGYLFARVYEWRLNMVTGEVKERNLTGNDFSMDFPLVNGEFTGLPHKYGFTQVIDSVASSASGMAKYGGLAKLHFDEPRSDETLHGRPVKKQLVRVEYHELPKNCFLTGSAFVPKQGGTREDDGWIISYVHNERTDVSHVHIVDARNFEGDPVAKITLPQRVPYGFHGTFIPM
ncbi:9-cis-epoxycarotenoid dioxygenase, partial [Bertholletia excelsa]